jgi:hypothetical protein
VRSALLLLAAALFGAPVHADPLDKVSGTEGWAHAGPENVELEWKDWFRARVAWRRASREMRVQRVVSLRLSKLLERSQDPSFDEIKAIIVSGMRELPASNSGAPPPAERPPPVKRKPPAPPPPDEGGEAAPTPAPRPRPPAAKVGEDWSKVPVERLDKDGQALDDEGDRVLKKAIDKKKKPR